MQEIGKLLKETRESSGISLEEASTDLKIKTLILENIEEGNMGCFKDIFVLKDYIYDYAKYLGLVPEKVIDSFNEYLFEYTSKIPVENIEKAVMEQKKEEADTPKVVSPYTMDTKKYSFIQIMLYFLLGILILVVVIWSVKQITNNNEVTNMVSYVK